MPSVAAAMRAAGPQPGVRLPGRLREQQPPPCRGPGPGPGGVWLAWRHRAPARSGIPDGPSARRGPRARGARAGRNRRFGTSSPAVGTVLPPGPAQSCRRAQRALGEPTARGGGKPRPGPDARGGTPVLSRPFLRPPRPPPVLPVR